MFSDISIDNKLTRINDSRALKQAIIAFLNIYPSEIPFEPNLGSTIRDYVFSPTTELTRRDLENIINSQLNEYFAFVSPRSTVSYFNSDSFAIEIRYIDIFTNSEETLSLVLNQ